MKSRPFLVAALLVLLASCSHPTEPGQTDLRVRALRPNLVLSNPGDKPIYYFVIEEAINSRTFWGPCEEPATCPNVSPGANKIIPYLAVPGFGSDAEMALVFWWHLEPDGEGGFTVDQLRVQRVRF
jgi:hypothetical protein